MADIDLDDFKRQWKGHAEVAFSPLNDAQLSACLRSASRTVGSRLLRSAWFDLALKAAILVTSIVAFVISSGAREAIVPFVMVWSVCAFGLVAQVRLLAAIPRLNLGDSTAVDVHRKLVEYYQRNSLMATIVQSITAPLLFVTGSMLFFLGKYVGFPDFDPLDLLVFGGATLLSFALSFFPLRAINEHQRRHVTANLEELQGEALDAERINAHRSGSKRAFLMLSILLLFGLAVLVYFLI
ncbi:MAG: hypothetical protein V2J10_06070 [Wenzhouxiangella sp.]|jgi:hypothetical protein|nr:hypothetical protein [Wenzhouxiangella sp.]